MNLNKTLKVEIGYDITPGEKMVKYYPDGSGHPGCPTSVEFNSVKALSLKFNYFNDKDDEIISREEKPDWFTLLDKIAEKIVMESKDSIELDILVVFSEEDYYED